MAYLKPPTFTQRVFNPIVMRFGWFSSEKLTVPGRRSGEPQEIPVIPVDVAGATYLVSTRGESAWVKNVRAAGSVTVGDRTLRAEELTVAERPAIIEAYRAKAGKQVEGYWKKLPEPEDHPVFRLG